MIPILFCALALLQTPPTPPPAPAKKGPRDFSEFLEGTLKTNNVPGMVVLALKGDEVIARGVAGVRKRGASDKIGFDDKFHIGSCTKAMTATVAAMLVEEGKLKWNTGLLEVFPDLASKAAAGWKEETLSALLLNRGGMPADLEPDGLWASLWDAKGPPPEQRRLLLTGVLSKPPLSQPGTIYFYANANFSAAGAMSEAVAGKPWEQLVQERLFKPLGMNSAGFGPPGSGSALDQPRGHDAEGNPVGIGPTADNPESITPAGRVHCSISDWSKFIALHLAGARAVRGLAQETGTKLLTKDSFEMLQTSPLGPDAGYAMGWNVSKRSWGGNMLSHAGSNTYWYCVAWLSPEKNLAAMACCNQGGKGAEKACDEAITEMIQKLLGNVAAPSIPGAAPGQPTPPK
jgi:CubicO group peptidase (beta-lactamase class C family)